VIVVIQRVRGIDFVGDRIQSNLVGYWPVGIVFCNSVRRGIATDTVLFSSVRDVRPIPLPGI